MDVARNCCDRPRFRCFPWKSTDKLYLNNPVGFHQEIIDFFNFISPSKTECFSRATLVRRIELLVNTLWPDSELLLHGSFKSGLYLPTADIDLCIWNTGIGDKIIALKRLEQLFLDARIALKNDMVVIEQQPVPVIRILDRINKYKVDVSLNTKNCNSSAELINSYIKEYPPFPYLVMVLKQYLFQHDLHEVFYKGISSYSLILMVVSFLQLHPRSVDWKNTKVNFGVLLLEFLELYGKTINPQRWVIKVTGGGDYLQKSAGMDDERLSIIDPLDENNDVGKSPFTNVKNAFLQAYILLSKRFLPPQPRYTKSLLAEIIDISKDVQDYRNYIEDTYGGLTDGLSHDKNVVKFASPLFSNYRRNYNAYDFDERAKLAGTMDEKLV